MNPSCRAAIPSCFCAIGHRWDLLVTGVMPVAYAYSENGVAGAVMTIVAMTMQKTTAARPAGSTLARTLTV